MAPGGGAGGRHENARGWSPHEDAMLLSLIEGSGKRWKQIAEILPNDRTPAMVRNRYLRIKRGRWLTEQGKSKNRCGICGQLKRGHVCLATIEPGKGAGGEEEDIRSSSSSTVTAVDDGVAADSRRAASKEVVPASTHVPTFLAPPGLAQPDSRAPCLLTRQDSLEVLAVAASLVGKSHDLCSE